MDRRPGPGGSGGDMMPAGWAASAAVDPEPEPEIEELGAAFNRARLSGDPPGVGPGPSTGDRRGCGRRRYAADVRHYAVWHVPGDSDAVGVWTGPYPAVWRALRERLPGKQYGKGVALHSAPTFDKAFELWESEAWKHDIYDLDKAFKCHLVE